MNRHTTARKGKRIRVVLITGRVFVEKLIEEKSRYYLFENEGAVMKRNIKSFAINKNE